MFTVFPVTPMGKPRMTQQDKWRTNPNHPDPRRRQRASITAYWQYKNDLTTYLLKEKFIASDTLQLCFFLPMPDSWSQKKRTEFQMTKHQQKPDIDNLVKGFLDIAKEQDCTVWHIDAKKYWTSDKTGFITVENLFTEV